MEYILATVLIFLLFINYSKTSGDEQIKMGFTEVLTEYSGAKCTVRSGEVPTWITGRLLQPWPRLIIYEPLTVSGWLSR